MSELRQNLATREWVVIAPERLKGKSLQKEPNAPLDSLPAAVDNCPFCPRNAARYENVELARVPHPAPTDDAPWLARAVENKYKILEAHADCPARPREFDRAEGLYRRYLGCGDHELVIESPRHNRTFATMGREEAEAALRLYRDRFNAVGQNPNNLLAILFKNHGPRSGASQLHPHAQLVGMRVVPNYVRFLLDEAQRHFDANGICVFCRMIAHELERGERLVYRNDRFVSFVPYAAAVPYAVQLLPREHDAVFGDMPDEELAAFADCLVQTLGRLYRALSNPDFNFILRNPPYPLSGVPFYHWHLQVEPRLVAPGGFELGSRVQVNPVRPEDAAAELRAAGG